MNAPDPRQDRLEELLVTRAIEGLDPVDDAELQRLLVGAEGVDPEAFDEAAAWFWVGSVTAHQAMPRDVAERALAAVANDDPGPRGKVLPLRRRRQANASGRFGWLAAAAALVVALVGWWPELQPPDAASMVAARDALIAEAPDLVRVDWSNTDHPRAQELAGGYVVWSDRLQQGYMTFRQMPANDPSRHQYQLWVFDAARSDDYPVDGGVFDAARNGDEVVIPIRTKLPVDHATLFAVTLEPPGGVVVSDRDPILWIAKPSGGTTS